MSIEGIVGGCSISFLVKSVCNHHLTPRQKVATFLWLSVSHLVLFQVFILVWRNLRFASLTRKQARALSHSKWSIQMLSTNKVVKLELHSCLAHQLLKIKLETLRALSFHCSQANVPKSHLGVIGKKKNPMPQKLIL